MVTLKCLIQLGSEQTGGGELIWIFHNNGISKWGRFRYIWLENTCTYNLGERSIFCNLGINAYSKGHILDIYTCSLDAYLGWPLLKLYSQIANRRGGRLLIFRNFSNPLEFISTLRLLISKKKFLIRMFLLLPCYTFNSF